MPVSSTSQQTSSAQWQTRLHWLGWTAAATLLAAGFWMHKLDNANQRALARLQKRARTEVAAFPAHSPQNSAASATEN